ncbi:MAG: UrcA family protein [Proteobacteria bacterium]|nr:UrcA family protein [Pseudomonadota bacterium]
MNRAMPGLALLAVSLVLMTPAHAHAADGAAALQVKIADLDATSPAGAKEILRRLQSAAAQVCGLTPRPSTVPGAEECASRAVGQAVYSANLPRLTSAYVNQTGRLPPH